LAELPLRAISTAPAAKPLDTARPANCPDLLLLVSTNPAQFG